MARKYSLLRSRLLLHRQVELATLEQKILDMDDQDSEAFPKALQSRKIDEGRSLRVSRHELMQQVDEKLKNYGKYNIL